MKKKIAAIVLSLGLLTGNAAGVYAQEEVLLPPDEEGSETVQLEEESLSVTSDDAIPLVTAEENSSEIVDDSEIADEEELVFDDAEEYAVFLYNCENGDLSFAETGSLPVMQEVENEQYKECRLFQTGTEVCFIANPQENYCIESVEVLSLTSEGVQYEVTEQDGGWYFFMPADNVCVEAEFVPEEITPVTGDPLTVPEEVLLEPDDESDPPLLKTGSSMSLKAAASDIYTVELNGRQNYGMAASMLPLINAERERLGRSDLTLDRDLTNAAMQRAAEIAVEFSHTRPDGSSCFSVSSKANGENIALGYSTAESTYQQWKDSPGHYANMIGANYKSIGIGHFVQYGTHFWVQLFSTQAASQTESRTETASVTRSVNVKKGGEALGFNLNLLGEGEALELFSGDTYTLEVGRTNPEWSWGYAEFAPGCFNWSSSNPSVVYVDSNGNLTAKAVGTATVTAATKIGGEKAVIQVNVKKNMGMMNISLSQNMYTYSGKSYTPVVTVKDGNTVLKEGTHYTLTYVDNTNAGTARVIVAGKGSYGGSTTLSFTISPLDISGQITADVKGYDYRGYSNVYDFLEDNVVVKYQGNILKPNEEIDFSGYSYAEGETILYSFYVDGMGNYTGSASFEYIGNGYIKEIGNKEYTGSAISPQPTVYTSYWAYVYEEAPLVKGTDYTCTWKNNTKAGTANVTVKGTGRYYGTASVTFTITPRPVSKTSVSLTKTTVTYTGKAQTPGVTVKDGGKTLKSGTDYTISYKNNVNPGSATVTITGKGNYTGTAVKNFTIKSDPAAKPITTPAPDPASRPTATPVPASGETVRPAQNDKIPSVSYRTHVQSIGWQDYVKDGAMSGTQGRSLRLEAININLENQPYSGGITYRTHVQTYGWQDWRSNGEAAGTSGESKRLEAIQIQLTGEMANHYDVYYQTHIQNFGWSGWACNGEMCGSAGYSYRLEGIRIVLVNKGSMAPGNIGNTFFLKPGTNASPVSKTSGALVGYNTHVQTYGWQNYAYDGGMAGTSGESKRLEGIHIQFVDKPYSGDIVYRTHVQTYGWQDWKKNGEMSGTSGESKRLEGIQIYLTGEMAKHYDVYYRVHAQTYGWLDYAKNGVMAGTSGLSKRLEGINIVLVPKGGAAPGATAEPYVVGGGGSLPDNPYRE